MSRNFYSDIEKNFPYSKVYFLYGREKYLLYKAEKLIIKNAINKKNEFNFLEIEGDALDLDSLDIYLNTYPVFSDKKCAIIKNLDIDLFEKSKFEQFENIIKSIPDFSFLVISQILIEPEKHKSAKWKKIFSSILKDYSVIECSFKNTKDFKNQLCMWANEKNKKLNSEVCEFLVKKCGENSTILRNEIDKVCAYEHSNAIQKDSINEVCVSSVDYNVFSICNLLFSGNYLEMYKQLEILFENNENSILILSAIASNYIDLFRVKYFAESGENRHNLEKYFDYKGKLFKIDIAYKRLSRIKVGDVELSIDYLIEADKDLKSSNVDPKIVLSLLIAKLVRIKEGKSLPCLK